ncbi:MAG: MFS transporter [Syntrophorhabdaceae bacterium]|nr:MFS transporter [Syntrophorhabdaceae bacterium]
MSEIKKDTRYIKKATLLVVLLGLVSLFADLTYEGARSVIGPYLNILGASALVVGMVSGFGELIGYGVRVLSGIVSDKTKRYWTVTIVGYFLNMVAPPALALTLNWESASLFIILERLGKAIRTPARDTILASGTGSLKKGWVFGIHEAMDQIGAIMGPLMISFVISLKGDYRYGFAILTIPAFLALTILFIVRFIYPDPEGIKGREEEVLLDKPFSKSFFTYLAVTSFIGMGFVDFAIIGYHVKTKGIFSDEVIPLLYAFAMGVDGITALILGRLYDKKGDSLLAPLIYIGALSSLFIFYPHPYSIVFGLVLWGISMGAIESAFRAYIFSLVPTGRMATGYGIFHGVFGVSWFIGSVIIGLLYTRSILFASLFSCAIQLLSIPFIFYIHIEKKRV